MEYDNHTQKPRCPHLNRDNSDNKYNPRSMFFLSYLYSLLFLFYFLIMLFSVFLYFSHINQQSSQYISHPYAALTNPFTSTDICFCTPSMVNHKLLNPAPTISAVPLEYIALLAFIFIA